MMPGEGDSHSARTLEVVEAAAVLLLEVKFTFSVPSVAQDAGHGERLDEDFGHDDGAAQAEPEAPPSRATRPLGTRKSTRAARSKSASSSRGSLTWPPSEVTTCPARE